jgi:quercetin dioxygenase-like cupin family protein
MNRRHCFFKESEMTLAVRRIVTGHDAEGVAVIVSDELIPAVSRQVGAGIIGSEMWSTDRMPVDNSSATLDAQRAGFVGSLNSYNYVGNGQGTTFRITSFVPGHARFTHRTESIDYAIVLSGTLNMELDEGRTISLRAGDVVVQRGTIHTWLNTGDTPAVLAFILIDAEPVIAGDTVLGTVYPEPA